MINRRQTIKLLSSASLFCALPSWKIYALRNSKYPYFYGWFAAVKIGVALYQHFNRDAANDTTALKYELLMNINKQLKAIDGQLYIIITQIEELKDMVDQLPEWVNDDNYKRQLASYIKSYYGLLETYALEKKELGKSENFFKEYMDRYGKRYEDIVNKMEDNGNILFGSENYLNTPIVTALCYVEFDIRKNYLKETKQRVKVILKKYIEYYEKMLYSDEDFSLNSIIKDTRRKRVILEDFFKQMHIYSGKTTFENTNSGEYTCKTYYNYSLQQDTAENEKSSLKFLVKNGFIEDEELFKIVDIANSETRAFVNSDSSHQIPNIVDVGKMKLPTATEQRQKHEIPPTDMYDPHFIQNQKETKQNELNLNTYKLLSSNATYAAGLSALNFCRYQYNLL